QDGRVRESGVAENAGVCRRAGDRGAQCMAARADDSGVDELMYKRILVPLENTDTDHAIVDHVRKLAKLSSSSVVFMHVADGFAARNANQLTLRESEEMRNDRDYLEKICDQLEVEGIEAECLLAGG